MKTRDTGEGTAEIGWRLVARAQRTSYIPGGTSVGFGTSNKQVLRQMFGLLMAIQKDDLGIIMKFNEHHSKIL